MICIDASVAAKWLFAEAYSAQARALLAGAIEVGEPLVAPPLLASEVTNAVRQQLRRGFVGPEEAPLLLAAFLAVPVILQVPENLYQFALARALELGLPATYDAQYLVVSEASGATFWTADARLFRATSSRLGFVRWIGDYTS